ncbi:bifunctional diaminohydroxyphosphoribosylaminopyrimidine deaminase/5-amino-6-(5-phosphoribosylamino)uracil reductase RibD [soil metagenome]
MTATGQTQITWTETDRQLMTLALERARTALGRVAPNPAVGAVLVRDGQIIGLGATQPPPGPHAESVALRNAGELARGADLYVTLEPCSHHGRTPPCAGAIIAAGVRRVIAATGDPHPLVNGGGIAKLRAAGIQVEVGLRADEALEIIGGFVTRVKTSRPRTTAKYAMTLDGRIATHTGHSRWVSGPESRQDVHIRRDRSDAILIGIGTLLADDPQLTTRLPDDLTGYGGPHHPLRIVLDNQARMPVNARMLAPETPGHTVIFVAEQAPADRVDALRQAGAEVVQLEEVNAETVLLCLGERGINDLLIEGGGTVLGAFFDAGLVDRVCIYIAPSIVGGTGAASPVGGEGVATMPASWKIVDRTATTLGDDLLIQGRVEAGDAHV